MAARNTVPLGSKGDKLWRDALMRAVSRRLKGKGSPKILEVLAERVVEQAMDGSLEAIKEIGNRLDGKAYQSVAITGDPENPIKVILIGHDAKL